MNDRFLTDDQIKTEGIPAERLANPTEPIELSNDRVLCPRHGEPFRAKWPTGYPTMALTAIQTLMEDPGFVELTGGNVAQINELLASRPICERISSPTLMALYIGSGIGSERRCDLCGERGLGTAYTMGTPKGEVAYRHVCFSCVIYRLIPAN